jgi:hypothetical protein
VSETPLPPWIELSVSGPITPEEIDEHIAAARDAATGAWEIIKIQRTQTLLERAEDQYQEDENSTMHIDALLDKPVDVFQRFLETKDAYSAGEQEELVRLFTIVLEMVTQEDL